MSDFFSLKKRQIEIYDVTLIFDASFNLSCFESRTLKRSFKGYSGYFMLLCFPFVLVLTRDHSFSSGDLLDSMCVSSAIIEAALNGKTACEIVVGTDV